jgi:acetate kinase
MILVLNAGSSSLKFAVFAAGGGEPTLLGGGQTEGIGQTPRFAAKRADGSAREERPLAASADHAEALRSALGWMAAAGIDAAGIRAAGHRIVHGGTLATAPMRIDADRLQALDALRALAPLHNGFGLDAIRTVATLMPDVPQVACFDTAFHATLPDEASRLPLPAPLHDDGYRRYGFHGLNYEHVVAELPRLSGLPLPPRLLVLHLGNGCSIAAIRDGRSVATTMGYSTLDGLIMGTRSGGIDPGVIFALMRDKGMSAAEVETLLYRRSGLAGLSGGISDMRALLASGDPACRRAVDHFCYWAARHAASLTAALGGLDALVFTGGIGANAPAVRARIAAHLGWMGVALDAEANAAGAALLSPASAPVATWIVPADEELAIARHALQLTSI